MEGDPVDLGVALLARLEHAELSVAEAMDRIEAITTEPSLQREILRTAERAGVIEREDGVLYPKSDASVSFEADVIVREGEFDCRRCGTSIGEGHFVALDEGELGPYGSSCIRKVTGRD